ncbi:MAG: ATP-dependent 6-phosphofructokinase [Pseudomonadota bacterium]|nr:ATP-dependent 6-phosphofructokinase [Pseudomonadota bacterium]
MHLLINTGGGDAPGLNAVIRAVTLGALNRGWRVTGIRYGYEGLRTGDPEGLVPLDRDRVRGIAHLGGTILGAINKGNPFEYPVQQGDEVVLTDVSAEVLARFRAVGGDALVAVGGDGSLRIAKRFCDLGLPVVGVPKTIDNDLDGTLFTFGFDTAVSVATEAIGRLHTTAESHRRVMVVEVMGRDAGWIALHAGIAGGADVILIPEIPFDIDSVCTKIRQREAAGRGFSIVVVAEGATPHGGGRAIRAREAGRDVQLGGIGEQVAEEIRALTGKETRTTVLGHIQRGGTPSAFDRVLALRFGAAAVNLVERGLFGYMVGYHPPDMVPVPIPEAVARLRCVPLDSGTVRTARSLGMCLGD